MQEREVNRVEESLAHEAPRVDSTAELASPLQAPEPETESLSEPVQSDQPAEGQSHESAGKDDVWRRVQDAIRERIQPEQFETWFRRMALVQLDTKQITLAVQNNFSRDWLDSYYGDVVEEAVLRVCGSALKIVVTVDPELTIPATNPASNAKPDDAVEPASRTEEAPAPRLVSDSKLIVPGQQATNPSAPRGDFSPNGLLWDSDIGLNEKYTFDNFVVGPCNRFAHAAAVGAAEAPGKAYNPFFLHGSVGLGKTHLLQSMCYSLLQRQSDVRILYLSCETFVNHFISALENGDLQKFRNKYRNVDVLVVDDIHILANKERTQEEFFHTFNTLYNAGKQIVLSSDSPPKDIPTLQDRLVSRFKWGLVTEIEPPCYETRMAILIRKSRERGRELPEDVARLLAEHIDTNIRELEGAVTRLIGFAGLSGQKVTCELAREVLRDIFTVRKGTPSIDEITRLVTEHFGVKLSELQSKKRTNAVAYPRQIAMFLARKITRHSLEEIGGFFGGRDHSTVLYAVEKISKLVGQGHECKQAIDEFMEQLQVSRSA